MSLKGQFQAIPTCSYTFLTLGVQELAFRCIFFFLIAPSVKSSLTEEREWVFNSTLCVWCRVQSKLSLGAFQKPRAKKKTSFE